MRCGRASAWGLGRASCLHTFLRDGRTQEGPAVHTPPVSRPATLGVARAAAVLGSRRALDGVRGVPGTDSVLSVSADLALRVQDCLWGTHLLPVVSAPGSALEGRSAGPLLLSPRTTRGPKGSHTQGSSREGLVA